MGNVELDKSEEFDATASQVNERKNKELESSKKDAAEPSSPKGSSTKNGDDAEGKGGQASAKAKAKAKGKAKAKAKSKDGQAKTDTLSAKDAALKAAIEKEKKGARKAATRGYEVKPEHNVDKSP